MKDGDAIRPDGGLPAASRTALRGPAVRRLLALRAGKKLTALHVRVAADAPGVSERTVWRWLATAQSDETAAANPGARSRVDARFTITPEVRGLLALWKGNVRAVHRELVLRAARQSPPADAPSLTTLHRAIRRDLTPGERTGLAGGSGRRASTTYSWPGRGAGATRCGRPTTSRRRCWSTSMARPAGRGSPGSPTARRTRSPVSRSRRGIRRGSRCWPRCAPRSCVRNPTARSAVCPRRYGWTVARTSCPRR